MKNFFKRIGIMQGRLCSDSLKTLNIYPNNPIGEFYLAKKFELSHIEFLTEEKLNPNNYIWDINKINLMDKNIRKYGLKRVSFTDNLSIEKKFYLNLGYYKKLIFNIQKLKINNFIIPLYNQGYFKKKNLSETYKGLKKLSNYCKNSNIKLLIESDINFENFQNLIKNVKNNQIGLVFDTGNRSIKKKNSNFDILKFKKNIKHVHLKDKDKYGKNVRFGKGLVNFRDFFKNLSKIDYDGYFTIEASRGNNPISNLKHNLKYIRKLM